MTENLRDDLRTFVTSFVTYVTIVFMVALVTNTAGIYLSSGATALQGFGLQSGRRRSAKLVPTFADRGASRGQRNGSPRPLISVYRTWIATYFIQVAPQLTSRGSRG